MTRLDWVLLFLEPPIQVAITLLRTRDENTTGVDDEAANAAEYFLSRLRDYRAQPAAVRVPDNQ